ncbi:uncharacterized protein SOCE26_072900 [Sorangium cellulosum]|uniref:Uncharacterized protein n=1 Tax=Sorangium cellulosum TaxID=56 RepID=A0A2L0F2J7_SORCE|nr:hypothetical protein [Sorangium cellulosum]AUX45794.1 uncharacterized protein SOCE26_072900 [Sorangium cellulosum]
MNRSAASEGAASAPSKPDADPEGSAPTDARRSFLEQGAVALGQTWAARWRTDLHREGRPAAGGWPGTLREARIQVENTLAGELLHRKMPPITGAERELAARTAYASARIEWRRHLEPETP